MTLVDVLPIDISRLLFHHTIQHAQPKLQSPILYQIELSPPWLSAIPIALLLSLFSGKNSKFETQLLPQTPFFLHLSYVLIYSSRIQCYSLHLRSARQFRCPNSEDKASFIQIVQWSKPIDEIDPGLPQCSSSFLLRHSCDPNACSSVRSIVPVATVPCHTILPSSGATMFRCTNTTMATRMPLA